MLYNPEIFKAYDIRGVYGTDFTDDFAFSLGAALVDFLKVTGRAMLVGHDDREFSPVLAEQIIAGIRSRRIKVEYIGLSTIPFFNFVLDKFNCAGGVMITASHNRSEWGGFKIFGQGGQYIGLGSGLDRIEELVDKNQDKKPSPIERGALVSNRLQLLDDYLKVIERKSGLKPADLKTVKISLSGTGTSLQEIEFFRSRYGFMTSDTDYDVSFSLDDDADRLIVKGRGGNIIGSDCIVGLLAKEAVRFLSKPRVAHDLRFSRGVVNKLREWGIATFRSKVGRFFVHEAMVSHRADIGGELSGHIYFKDANYNELPLLAMLRILKIMLRSKMGIEELIKPFRTWQSSGEINVDQNENIKNKNYISKFKNVVEILKSKYADGKIDELDGITVEYDDWWFNFRPSNTEPVWRLIVEAREKEVLDKKVQEVRAVTEIRPQ